MMEAQNVVPISEAGRRRASRQVDEGSELPPPPAGCIAWTGGELDVSVWRTLERIAEMKMEIYEFGGFLVRPGVIAKPMARGVYYIPENLLTLIPLDAECLAVKLTGCIAFYKFDARSWRWVPIDCPPKLAKAILAMRGMWGLRWLRGIVQCPTLRRNGSWLDKDGYDRSTGLYIHTGGLELECPRIPNEEDAAAGRKKLEKLLAGFPFIAPEDLSVAMAAILTALVRHALATAPLFAFDAPTPGSGKTLLVDVAALIATGRPAVTVSQGSTPEEQEKRLASLLMACPPVINLDNLEAPLSGEFLCSLLTRESVSVRVLGESRMVEVPTALTICATGNNLEVVGDMCRRTLVCRLDAKTERPDARSFSVDLYKEIPRWRSRLVGCALSILKAYDIAGRPDQGLAPYGSFQEWSDWVRSALVWVGMADPCLTRTRLESVDPIITELSAVLSAWSVCLPGGVGWTVRDLIAQCELTTCSDLKAAFLDVASSRRDPNQIDPRRLGHWLKRAADRMVNGRRIERDGDLRHATIWKITSVS